MLIVSVFAALLTIVPLLVRKIRDLRHKQLLANQLRQALQNMVHALRIGVGFQQALECVAEERDLPLAAEWQRLLQAMRVGSSWGNALSELRQRVDIPEMGWFVSAVQITQSSGGILADVLETLSETLQERQTLRDKVSALTAQGKASGAILALLPFILLGALQLIVPDMVRPMFTTLLGQALIAGVMVSVSIGGVLIWKIVTIKVD